MRFGQKNATQLTDIFFPSLCDQVQPFSTEATACSSSCATVRDERPPSKICHLHLVRSALARTLLFALVTLYSMLTWFTDSASRRSITHAIKALSEKNSPTRPYYQCQRLFLRIMEHIPRNWLFSNVPCQAPRFRSFHLRSSLRFTTP